MELEHHDGFAIFELIVTLLRGLALTNILQRDYRAPELVKKLKEITLPHLEAHGSRPADPILRTGPRTGEQVGEWMFEAVPQEG